MRLNLTILSVCLFGLNAGIVYAQSADVLTGAQIMQEVQQRNSRQNPVYEEQTVILTDQSGNRDTRNVRSYIHTDKSGNTRYLLIFDTPVDVHGVALLANRSTTGQVSVNLYLPATGKEQMQSYDPGAEGNLVSTDFSLEQLLGDPIEQYQYVLAGQQKTGVITHYLVDVYRNGVNVATTRPLHRHYVRQDSFFITRTDYFDAAGKLQKQKTLFDLKQTGGGSWHAGMILMQDRVTNHTTLIKNNKTVFSVDYVPDEVFSNEWLYRNQPPIVAVQTGETGSEAELSVPSANTGVQ